MLVSPNCRRRLSQRLHQQRLCLRVCALFAEHGTQVVDRGRRIVVRSPERPLPDRDDITEGSRGFVELSLLVLQDRDVIERLHRRLVIGPQRPAPHGQRFGEYRIPLRRVFHTTLLVSQRMERLRQFGMPVRVETSPSHHDLAVERLGLDFPSLIPEGRCQPEPRREIIGMPGIDELVEDDEGRADYRVGRGLIPEFVAANAPIHQVVGHREVIRTKSLHVDLENLAIERLGGRVLEHDGNYAGP